MLNCVGEPNLIPSGKELYVPSKQRMNCHVSCHFIRTCDVSIAPSRQDVAMLDKDHSEPLYDDNSRRWVRSVLTPNLPTTCT